MDIFIIFFIGTIFGSFYNVVICRLPYEKSIVFPPSSCPICGEKIKWYDNIPIISFLLLKGKCRSCGSKISLRYLIVEFLVGLFSVGLYLRYGLSVDFLKFFVLFSILFCAGVIDLITAFDEKFETGIIPDELSLGGLIPGFVFGLIQKRIWLSILGSVVGFLLLFLPGFIYKLLTGKEGMGGGDIKLFAMIGSFLGYKPMFFILFFSSLIGAVVGIFFIKFFKNRDYPIPFGPFIALGTFFYIFCGDIVIEYYLKMISS